MVEQDPVQAFAELVQRPETDVNLARAALHVARTEYPQLEIEKEMAKLDRLAQAAAVDTANPPLENIRALNELLFGKERFSGNELDYDDPRNSYLNDVLNRKLGIPITLSVVYLEVAWRRGLALEGVNFPGHFLVKYSADSGEIIIDPFHRGKILTLLDCRELLHSQFGKDAEVKPEYLAAATSRQILARMLNNLKGSYSRRKNYTKVLTMIELALALDPGSLQDIRDRGMVHLAMRHYRAAMADFKAYLNLSPQDDPQVKEVLQALSRLQAMMN